MPGGSVLDGLAQTVALGGAERSPVLVDPIGVGASARQPLLFGVADGDGPAFSVLMTDGVLAGVFVASGALDTGFVPGGVLDTGLVGGPPVVPPVRPLPSRPMKWMA